MKILVGFDESEGSFYALRWALDTLFNHGNHDFGSLLIVNASQAFQQYFFPAGPGVYITPAVIQSVKHGQEENSARLLGQALALCSEKHCSLENLVMMMSTNVRTIASIIKAMFGDFLTEADQVMLEMSRRLMLKS